LYRIDVELEDLLEHRQARLDDQQDPATAEEIAAIDDEIQRYIGTLTKKVDGTAGLLLRWKAQQQAIAAERARLKALAQRIESQEQRLRDYIELILSRQPAPAKGPRRLRGETSELVLRANGGPAPLVIAQPELVPHELQIIELSMPYDLWEELLRNAARELTDRIADAKQRILPSNQRIREELSKPCPVCGGTGCVECGGTGCQTVPGAYLAERGSWIEIR